MTEATLIEHGFKQVDELTFENDLFIVNHNIFKNQITAGWRILLKNNTHPYLLPSHIQTFNQLRDVYKLFTQKEL